MPATFNAAAILARLDAAKKEMRADMERGLDKMCAAVGEYAKDHHTYVKRSGDTEASTKGGALPEQPDPNKIVGVITAGMPYDEFLETTRKSGSGAGEAIGEGRYIREAYAFITPALTAKQGDMLKILADEAKK